MLDEVTLNKSDIEDALLERAHAQGATAVHGWAKKTVKVLGSIRGGDASMLVSAYSPTMNHYEIDEWSRQVIFLLTQAKVSVIPK